MRWREKLSDENQKRPDDNPPKIKSTPSMRRAAYAGRIMMDIEDRSGRADEVKLSDTIMVRLAAFWMGRHGYTAASHIGKAYKKGKEVNLDDWLAIREGFHTATTEHKISFAFGLFLKPVGNLGALVSLLRYPQDVTEW